MLLLRRQSKGFVRTATKFRGVTKDRVSHCVCLHSQYSCPADHTQHPLQSGLVSDKSSSALDSWKRMKLAYQEKMLSAWGAHAITRVGKAYRMEVTLMGSIEF